LLDDVLCEIREYLRENMGIYIVVSSLLVGGVCAGSLVVRWLDTETLDHLYQSFHLFLESLESEAEVSRGSIIKASFRQNLLQVVLIWLAGIFAPGFPFVLGMVIFRGFTVGFTVTFLVEKTSYYGILFSLGAILPHNLVIIPAFLVIAVTGFSLSYLNFKERYLEKREFKPGDHLGAYSLLIFLMFLLIMVGCLVEAYVSLVFMQLLVPLMP